MTQMIFASYRVLNAISISLIASPADITTDLTTYTFSSLNTSSVLSTDRLVAVIQAGETTATTSSVTIGGNSANIDADVNFSSKIVFASITGFTGATASVVVTFSSGQARCRCSLVKLSGSDPISFFDTGSASAASGTGLTMTNMNIPANGIALVGDYHGTQSTTTAWSAGDVSILRDGDIEALSFASFGSIPYRTTARTSHTVTTTHTNSTQPISLVGASYGY